MSLEEFISNSHRKEVPLLKTGVAKSLDEVYANIVKPNLPSYRTIKDWDEVLLQYIAHPEAVFFIRRYASAPKKRWDLIRRGFLTEHSCGFKYVFCDNYFAHYFYLMALKDFVPTLKELIIMMKERRFPYGYMKTSEEAPYQAYPRGRPVYINRSGWKLAHLYSVNQNDYDLNYRQISAHIFPRGEQKDWEAQRGQNYPSRYIEEAIHPDVKKIAIAHFLRLVHPINYFLVPKRKLSNLDIGEKPELISYMRKRIYERYPCILSRFEDLVRAKKHITNDLDQFEIYFQYGRIKAKADKGSAQDLKKINNDLKITTRSSKDINNSEGKYSERDLRIIGSYLIKGLSYRSIEKDILEIESPVRGGGFIAKGILNTYGVEGKHKGTITLSNIDDNISIAEPTLKRTLIELKKFLCL